MGNQRPPTDGELDELAAAAAPLLRVMAALDEERYPEYGPSVGNPARDRNRAFRPVPGLAYAGHQLVVWPIVDHFYHLGCLCPDGTTWWNVNRRGKRLRRKSPTGKPLRAAQQAWARHVAGAL